MDNQVVNWVWENRQWVFSGIGVVVLVPVGKIIMTICRYKREKVNVNNMERDRLVYKKITNILQWDGSISFIREHDFYGNFDRDDLRDLYKFCDACQNPHFYFIDSGLEKIRKTLWRKIDQFLQLVGEKTYPIGNSNSNEVPWEWKRDSPGREKAWSEKVDMFRTEATTLMVEAIMFSNHPGWPDMLQIIVVNTSIGTLEGEKQASLKFTTALMQWSQKWQVNGEGVYSKFQSLGKRLMALNDSREALKKEQIPILSTHNKLLQARLLAGLLTPEVCLILAKSELENAMKTESELKEMSMKPFAILGLLEKFQLIENR